jgi:hypothetical protein
MTDQQSEQIITARKAFLEMERAVSRRAFFGTVLKSIAVGAGSIAALDRFGPRMFGQSQSPTDQFNTALQVLSGFGQMVIPVDQDPGWATFEPDITMYALDVYIRQVFNLGVDLAFNGFVSAVNSFNAIPPLISYGPAFLSMSLSARQQYLSDILVGNFENDGVQDIVAFAGVFLLLGAKMVFFQNFPHHIADPNAEFQQVLGNTPKTAWDIIGFKGPVLAAEEAALRARAAGAPEIPGVDWRNPFI